ncbi:hypothetical protein VTN77DRAFT_4395 [Rasamsonia byssochlamydoides]|uniref:uncharacterized protein n=1 Tax=Rasamsonia byssochlamydoides TaxID=89139 RepID=UPI0037444921
MEGASAPPIAAAPGGFSSSFLRRHRNAASTSSLPPPLRSLVTSVFPAYSHLNAPSQAAGSSSQAGQPPSPKYLETLDEAVPFVPRDLDRYPRGQSPFIPFPPSWEIRREENDRHISNGTPSHSRLASEPVIPVLKSLPPLNHRSEAMALQPPLSRPPPLNIDANSRRMSSSSDPKPPKTPGSKITSFFGWKTTSSPGAESSSTEISDAGRSPLPSPLPQAFPNSPYARKSIPVSVDSSHVNGFANPGRNGSLSAPSGDPDLVSKIQQLENELREISTELAGSIRREIELEDLVEKLQMEANSDANRRTSDYFSDSGTISIRAGSESAKVEDIEKIKRAAEQERAQLKVELSQRWQEERSRRTACEAHVQLLESQVQQFRKERVDASNLSSKTKELETALEDTRRKLAEERQLKDNFEDLLTAMRVELEQLRNERDHLRDEVVPQLLQQKNRVAAIAEEEGAAPKRGSMIGLSRSNSLARMPRSGGGLSRSNSVSAKDRESRETLAERVKDVEAQRDALHKALKNLLDRQAYQARDYEKRIKILELELQQAKQSGTPRKLGYEREVRNLREEMNSLRRRAEEALEQKWQCEKGLSGLKMDLDRAEQETSSLRALLQEHDIDVPEHLADTQEGLASVQATSSSLEAAYQQLQADMEYAEANAADSLDGEQMSRTEALAEQVRQQLETNNALRRRLAEAIAKGERDQKLSAARINELQNKLKNLEDNLMVAQHHSEEEIAKHEEEIRALKESHNAHLHRARNGIKSPVKLSPRLPTSPFSGSRSPRLDKTTSGDGVPLSEMIQMEKLEMRVKELEKALRDAEFEMEEVVGRMNKAQIEVAELQSDRDEALRQTRRLEAEIQAEREKVKALVGQA